MNTTGAINYLIHKLEDEGFPILDSDDPGFKLDGVIKVDGQIYFKAIPVDFKGIIDGKGTKKVRSTKRD